MGGFGSGRWWGCQTREKAEHCASLDVRRLHRDGLLRPGHSNPYHWKRNGQRAASSLSTTFEDRIVLSYQRLIADEDWRIERYPVLLEWINCTYGGRRAWVPLSNTGLRKASCDSLSPGHLRVPGLPTACICQPANSSLGTCFGAGPGNPRAPWWNRQHVRAVPNKAQRECTGGPIRALPPV